MNTLRNEIEPDGWAALARREPAALAALYDQTHSAVFGLLLCLLPERQSAKAVLLEVYEEIWQQSALRGALHSAPLVCAPLVCAPLVWLMQCARQRALARLPAAPRAFSARLDLTASVADEPESDETAAQRHRVRRALLCLTVAQRRALEYAYFGGLDYHATAARLGLSLDETKTLLTDGLRTLRDLLSRSH